MPAPRKANPKDVAADLDDLLAPEPEQDSAPVEYALVDSQLVEVPAEPEDETTPEEAEELARLTAELAKPVPEPEPAAEVFVPYEKLSPAQKKIRDLRDAVARRDAEIAERQPVAYDSAESADSVMIHILEDGFTACGQVWYRGQEIRFVRGGEAYEQTRNRLGASWLDLDESAQWNRWGKKMFGLGPWPGKQWGDTSGVTDEAEIAAIKQAAAREARRRAAAPIIRS